MSYLSHIPAIKPDHNFNPRGVVHNRKYVIQKLITAHMEYIRENDRQLRAHAFGSYIAYMNILRTVFNYSEQQVDSFTEQL
jgi:hypothetical protein